MSRSMRRWSIAGLVVLLALGLASIGIGRAIEARIRADLPATAKPPVQARLVSYERGWFQSTFEAEWTQPAGPSITSRVRVAHGPIPWAAALDDPASLLPSAAWVRSETQIDAADGSALARIPRLPPFLATTRVGLGGRSGTTTVAAYDAPLAADARLVVEPGFVSWSEDPDGALRAQTEWPGFQVTSGTSTLGFEGLESAFETTDWRSPLPLGQTQGRVATLYYANPVGRLVEATGLRFRDERRSEQGRLAWASRLEADELRVLEQALQRPSLDLEVEHVPIRLLEVLQGLSAGLAAGPDAKATTQEEDLLALQRELASQEVPPRVRASFEGELDAGPVALDARAWLAARARLDLQAIGLEAELRLPRAWVRASGSAAAPLGLVPGAGLLGVQEIWTEVGDGQSVSASLRIREGQVSVSGMPLDFLQQLAEERSGQR